MPDVIAERQAEQQRLVELARGYVVRLSARIPLTAAVVVGSVARGDFNVWSDVDVVIVAEDLPERAPDRAALLLADAPGGVQPVGFTPTELTAALGRGNPLAAEAVGEGLVLTGRKTLRRLSS